MCQNSRLKRFLSRLNLHFKHLIAQNIFDVSNVIRVAFSQVVKNIYQPTDSKNNRQRKNAVHLEHLFPLQIVLGLAAARRDNAKAKGATNIFSSIFIFKTSFIYPSYLYFIMLARGHKC